MSPRITTDLSAPLTHAILMTFRAVTPETREIPADGCATVRAPKECFSITTRSEKNTSRLLGGWMRSCHFRTHSKYWRKRCQLRRHWRSYDCPWGKKCHCQTDWIPVLQAHSDAGSILIRAAWEIAHQGALAQVEGEANASTPTATSITK